MLRIYPVYTFYIPSVSYTLHKQYLSKKLLHYCFSLLNSRYVLSTIHLQLKSNAIKNLLNSS